MVDDAAPRLHRRQQPMGGLPVGLEEALAAGAPRRVQRLAVDVA
jgi:hypothetical protein